MKKYSSAEIDTFIYAADDWLSMEDTDDMDFPEVIDRFVVIIKQLRSELADGKCDACLGAPISENECMCGGTGLARDAVIYLREQLLKQKNITDKAAAAMKAERELSDALVDAERERCIAIVKRWSSNNELHHVQILKEISLGGVK